MPAPFVVREISSPNDIRAFIQFPKSLYKGCPFYVPPLDNAEYKLLTKHPALEFCSLKLWLAYQNGEIVGRIAGIINHKCNELKNQKRVRFAWFDTIDSYEVASALLQQVEQWGRSQHLHELCGPSRFSNMEKQALLVEGFTHVSTIEADYNYPYYAALLEQFGLQKEVDYLQYQVAVHEVPDSIQRLAEKVKNQTHVRLRKFKSKKELRAAGREFFHVINQSYQQIFNFVPLTDKEIDFMIANTFSVAQLDLVDVLENERGELVGISFCLPSLSRAFQRAKGRLFPFGWWHILRALRRNQVVDMYLTGVVPAYANSGIHIMYHQHLNETFLQKGYQFAVCSQQLESNPALHIWSRYQAEPLYRRRCYVKKIDE